MTCIGRKCTSGVPRGRPNKEPGYDREKEIQDLIDKAVELFQIPYDDRCERPTDAPSIRFVAEQMNSTHIRVRKLLITAGYYSTALSRKVQGLSDQGYSIQEIMDETGLNKASVMTYLPYEKTVYDLEDKSGAAKRTEKWRERRNDDGDWKLDLWRRIIAMEGQTFTTSGRGSRPGVEFKYEISRAGGSGGRHYNGESVPGFGNELWIIKDGVRKEKSISRSTVELAYRRAQEADGDVAGPRALSIPGAHSYLYPILVKLGVIRK